MIASALKKLLTHVHFRKSVSVEEQRAQGDDRFLRGGQIAHMICEYFRAIGAFDTRWDQALLKASERPTKRSSAQETLTDTVPKRAPSAQGPQSLQGDSTEDRKRSWEVF